MKILLKIAPLLILVGFIILLGSLSIGIYNIFGIIGTVTLIAVIFIVTGLIILDLNGTL